jgi:hypothetical protein
VRFRDRAFEVGFRVRIEGVAAPHDGAELAPLAGQLDALPDAATWSVRMRRSLLPLSDRDATMILDLLDPKLRRRTDVPGRLPRRLQGDNHMTDGGRE